MSYKVLIQDSIGLQGTGWGAFAKAVTIVECRTRKEVEEVCAQCELAGARGVLLNGESEDEALKSSSKLDRFLNANFPM